MDQQASADSQRIWIACIPQRPTIAKPPSAIGVGRCHVCECRVWMAPSTIEVLLCRPDLAKTICVPCWVQHMKDHPKEWEDFRVGTTERQQHEVFSNTGITVEQAIERLFGVTAEMLDLKGRS